MTTDHPDYRPGLLCGSCGYKAKLDAKSRYDKAREACLSKFRDIVEVSSDYDLWEAQDELDAAKAALDAAKGAKP